GARASRRTFDRPFAYRHYGSLATIGRKSAVADFGRVRLSGFAAWIVWALVHVYFLIGWRNRAVVSINWLWSYLTFERGARPIVSQGGETTHAVIDRTVAKAAAEHVSALSPASVTCDATADVNPHDGVAAPGKLVLLASQNAFSRTVW